MRRYLILFLAFLLPLQVSWAVMANYCAHEQEQSTRHLGHHQDEHHASVNEVYSKQQPAETSSIGHDHDHLSAFVALLLDETSSSLDVLSPLPLSGITATLSSLPPDRLERPNWFAPA